MVTMVLTVDVIASANMPVNVGDVRSSSALKK
jgi:hypothetical protein